MLDAKRHGSHDGMCSGTHRSLWNVNASTRGFDICPGAGNAKNGERVSTCAPRPVLRSISASTCPHEVFRIYSPSFLVSRQREGRRADST